MFCIKLSYFRLWVKDLKQYHYFIMQVNIFSDIKFKYPTEKKLIKLIYFILFSGTISIYCIE